MTSSKLMMTDIYDFYIRPNAARTKIDGLYGDRIKIRVAAAPEKGKANRELIRLISEITGVAKKKIRIISGAASNYKKIKVEGDQSIDYSEVLLRNSQTIR